jgi:hypothetical protein
MQIQIDVQKRQCTDTQKYSGICDVQSTPHVYVSERLNSKTDELGHDDSQTDKRESAKSQTGTKTSISRHNDTVSALHCIVCIDCCTNLLIIHLDCTYNSLNINITSLL